jgi:hypothetical protein
MRERGVAVLTNRINHYPPLLVEGLTSGGDQHSRRTADEDSRSIGGPQMGHRLANKPRRNRLSLTELDLTARPPDFIRKNDRAAAREIADRRLKRSPAKRERPERAQHQR